ncbi:ribosome 60S biogenesis N-terminal-domain-containing protein [Auriculariales sp. MPI-PUGE-AT-0066]|nr:ribosome 60S biogenesis N-terminal-domain-containing protein [Auriculariales sp. MPI-PUGE-AT-0066]
MSTKRKSATDGGPVHQKKVKVQQASPAKNFHSASEIHAALQSQDQEELSATLLSLRNRFTTKPDEVVAPQDARLILAKAWLDAYPGAQDAFVVWEASIRNRAPLQHLAMGVLASVLNLLSAHFIYHAAGWPVVKTLLSPTWMRRLNTNVNAGQTDIVLGTLKLLNAISDFGGGREKITLLKSFNWNQKSLPRLFNMRRKGKEEQEPLARPDIRTLYVLFLLSFLAQGTPSTIKTTFLEEHRESFWFIFRGLHVDPYPVVRRVLEICWEGVWLDPKVKRTLKIASFSETTLAQIVKLYQAPADESADVAHHFLLAICTRPGTGVCFRDRGWYPREHELDVEEDGDDERKKTDRGGKVHNKMLASVLRILKVNEDARQQELALRIMAACPELVPGFWPAASLTFEARLASTWLINMAFLGSVAALPVPTASFLLASSTSYNPTPPPLRAVLESVLPTSALKTTLAKGLQSASGLVQHAAALALSRCLEKLDATLNAFAEVGVKLEEGADGQWTSRQVDLLHAARSRLPDFQVVVAFALNQLASIPTDADESRRLRVSLLSEAGLRVIWLYHRTLQELVSEARFDVGKLLTVLTDIRLSEAKLARLNQLHVLRTLSLSDQFSWSAKLGSTGRTHLHFLLKVYLSGEASIQAACADLLKTLLRPSVLFSHDASGSELALWLDALPRTQRAPDARSPDDFALTDEAAGVMAFLDECITRCTKTPYRYLEDVQALASGYAPSQLPSPLLATLLEQLAAPRTFAPSDSLAIFTFIRKLVLTMVGRQPDTTCAVAVAQVVRDKCLPKADQKVVTAVEREVSLLESSLQHLVEPFAKEMPTASDPRVLDFFDSIDLQPKPAEPQQARISACELVDWLRLVDIPLTAMDIVRLHTIVAQLSYGVASELVLYLPPASGISILAEYLPSGIPFGCAFSLATAEEVEQPDIVARLASLALTKSGPLGVLHAVQIVLHRLSASQVSDAVVRSHANLLAFIAQTVKRERAFALEQLKSLLFVESTTLQTLFRTIGLSDTVQTLLSSLLDPAKDTDRAFVANHCAHWTSFCLNAAAIEDRVLNTIIPWIPFMQQDQRVHLLVAAIQAQHLPLVRIACDEIASHDITESVSSVTDLSTELLALLRKHIENRELCNAALRLLSTLVSAGLPLNFDGTSDSSITLSEVDAAWNCRRNVVQLPSFVIDALVEHLPLQRGYSDLLRVLIYRYPQQRPAFAKLLNQEPDQQLLPALHALLDVYAATNSTVDFMDASLTKWEKKLVSWVFQPNTTETGVRRQLKDFSRRCLLLLAESQPQTRHAVNEALVKRLKKKEGLLTDVVVLSLVQQLTKRWPKNFSGVGSQLVNDALQALVRHYVEVKEDASADSIPTMYIASIAGCVSGVKVQFVDPFMVAAIQYRLAVRSTMELASALVTKLPLKPANTNRYLQSVIQHPQVAAIAGPSSIITSSSTRLVIIDLLHGLFHKHPSNSCQASHMGPLLRLYGGTIVQADRLLLSTFHLYEQQRGASSASFLVHWTGSVGGSPSARSLQALTSLDAARVFRSATPLLKSNLLDFEHHVEEVDKTTKLVLYDPVFIVQLFSHCLLESSSYTALEWVEIFRTNAASVLVAMLSHREDRLRHMASLVLGSLWTALPSIAFQERDQTMYILNLLRDTIPTPPNDAKSTCPERVPLYTTLLLAHALRGLYHPAAPIYPITSRFLLQRDALDVRDVPLLYSMLYSAATDGAWRREQAWILRFLADGTAGELEWRVLRRRHTWDLVATLFGSTSDQAVRSGVLQLLANLTCIKTAATSLVLKSQLLAWIELHVNNDVHVVDGEDLAWLRILENIVCAPQPEKLDRATSGGWRDAVARCVGAILAVTDKLDSLLLAARILLRIVHMPFAPSSAVCSTLDALCTALLLLEPLAAASRSLDRLEQDGSQESLFLPPHRGSSLIFTNQDTQATYVHSIELAWRAALATPRAERAWNILTPRVIASHANYNDNTSVGQWARRALVASFG